MDITDRTGLRGGAPRRPVRPWLNTQPWPGLPTSLSRRRPVLAASSLWWLHPSLVIMLVLVPIYLSILAYDFGHRVAVTYVPSFDYWFGLALLLAMVLGIQWALTQQPAVRAASTVQVSGGALIFLLIPTLLSYVVWFGPVLMRPDLLLEVWRGERPEIRDDISTIKGVTTFTQWGVAYVIGYGIKAAYAPQSLTRVHRIGLLLVFVLAAFRAFAWAERLAVIELTICFVVTRLSHLQIPEGWRSRAMRVVPAVAPLALFGLFSLSEYFRTWEHLQSRYSSVWELSLDRLITYYATAVNNGIGVLTETKGWPFYSTAFAFESLWRMPGLEPVLVSAFGDPRWVEIRWLSDFGDPAFNSPTAYFRTILDLGYFGSVMYHVLLGYLIGRAYFGWRSGQRFGLLMFAVFLLHLLESLRFSYLAETRFVPLVLGLIVLAADMHVQARKGVGA